MRLLLSYNLKNIINVVIILATLLAYLSPFLSPSTFWFLGICSYFICPCLMLQLMLTIYGFIRKSRLAYINLMLVLFGFLHLDSLINLTSPKEIKHDVKWSVMSYNVRYFNTGADGINKTRIGLEKMIDDIQIVEADVLCIQENYNNNNTFANTKDQLIQVGYANHFIGNRNISNSNDAGLAIYSKHPIINTGQIAINTHIDNKAIFVDLILYQDTLRIYNVHFYSLGISNRPGLVKLLREVKNAYKNKPQEVSILIDHMLRSPYDVVLCGDFNDYPLSHTYKRFEKHWNNSFDVAGLGLGATYHGAIPWLRIDHQFSSSGIQIMNHRVLTNFSYTDHFPILVEYKLNELTDYSEQYK